MWWSWVSLTEAQWTALATGNAEIYTQAHANRSLQKYMGEFFKKLRSVGKKRISAKKCVPWNLGRNAKTSLFGRLWGSQIQTCNAIKYRFYNHGLLKLKWCLHIIQSNSIWSPMRKLRSRVTSFSRSQASRVMEPELMTIAFHWIMVQIFLTAGPFHLLKRALHLEL